MAETVREATPASAPSTRGLIPGAPGPLEGARSPVGTAKRRKTDIRRPMQQLTTLLVILVVVARAGRGCRDGYLHYHQLLPPSSTKFPNHTVGVPPEGSFYKRVSSFVHTLRWDSTTKSTRGCEGRGGRLRLRLDSTSDSTRGFDGPRSCPAPLQAPYSHM